MKGIKSVGPVFDSDYRQRKNPFTKNVQWIGALLMLVMFGLWIMLYILSR